MTDDLMLLASSYLDGDLTAEGRARVEADPEALAAVERLRVAATAVADVDVPDPARREQAIGAALRVFDELHHRTVVTSAPIPRRSMGGRLAPARWLPVAAAVLAIGVLGTVAISSLTGRGSDDGGFSDIASVEVDDGSAERLESADSALAEPDGAPEMYAGDPDSNDTDSNDATGSASVADDAHDGRAGVPAADLDMRTPDDLADAARQLLAVGTVPDSAPLVDGAPAPCSDVARVIGAGTYLDQPVLIAVDDPVTRVFALEPVTCDIVAETSLDPAD